MCIRDSQRRVRDCGKGMTVSSCDCLVLGPPGSGKTVMVRHLVGLARDDVPDSLPNTQPTMGIDLEDIRHCGQVTVVREVGGSMTQIWPDYYETCSFVVFVVDAMDTTATAMACIAFLEVLSHPHLAGKPVLLVLNSRGCHNVVSRSTLNSLISLDELVVEQKSRGRIVEMLETNVLSGEGLDPVLEWINSSGTGE
eukprot:TRINITY_DN17606_c0_g1_i2.p1 TRINITY_DN17606_c0_g1~~TRINITY_DN17606_c0_g1_i2.p1  ORF type:complete len:196 (+),score=36.19 TRINITY_DN17606_c0_g1_i2:87-674(+)